MCAPGNPPTLFYSPIWEISPPRDALFRFVQEKLSGPLALHAPAAMTQHCEQAQVPASYTKGVGAVNKYTSRQGQKHIPTEIVLASIN